MIMRLVKNTLFLLLFVSGVIASGNERITLIAGALKVIDLPFAMQNFRPSTDGIVRVESFSNKRLRIIGVKKGFCELEVNGGGLSKVYSISVVDNISEIMKQLQNDLDSLPELEISINQDYIVIKGDVSNISKWEHLNRVLALPKFKSNCQNYARFRPAPEIMLSLQNLFEKAGFTVTNNVSATKPGEISLFFTDNVLTITGKVFNQTDIETVNTILATQNWLKIVRADNTTPNDHKVKTIVKLQVAPITLWVDIVYVAIRKQDTSKVGSTGVPVLSSSFAFLQNFLKNEKGNVAVFSGRLDSVVQFLAGKGVNRFHDAGCVVLKSNDPKGGTQHIGGTKYIRIPGAENGGLQQVDYGLKLTVKGGLISKDKVDLSFSLSNSSSISAGESDSFDQTKEDITNSIICELDNTVVLGGCKRVVESTVKSGLPILRNTPVIQWFVSEDNDGMQENELLILACPRIQKNTPAVKIKIPVVDEVAHIAENGKQTNKQLEDEEKRYRGWLSWLNWFVW